MKLQPQDKLWCPEDKEQYLLVLQSPRQPQTLDQFLQAHARLLERLAEEEDEKGLEAAGQYLDDHLEPEILDWLPANRFHDPKTPELLMILTPPDGSPLHEWKKEAEDSLRSRQMAMPFKQAKAAQLTLLSRLQEIL